MGMHVYIVVILFHFLLEMMRALASTLERRLSLSFSLPNRTRSVVIRFICYRLHRFAFSPKSSAGGFKLRSRRENLNPL